MAQFCLITGVVLCLVLSCLNLTVRHVVYPVRLNPHHRREFNHNNFIFNISKYISIYNVKIKIKFHIHMWSVFLFMDRFSYSPKLIIFSHRLSPTINSGVTHDVMICDISNWCHKKCTCTPIRLGKRLNELVSLMIWY